MKARGVLIILIIIFISKNAFCFDVSSFNPIGNSLKGIKKDIPNLDIKGFLENETDLNLHERSYETQKIEWLAEMDLRYKLSENKKIVNIYNYLYDSMFDWDAKSAFSSATEKELERYHTEKRILRELYLDWALNNWKLILGKQQVAWGKVDGRKVLDMLHPEDFREGPWDASMDDWRYTRIPLWMANISWIGELYNFQFLWIPDFEESPLIPEEWIWGFKRRPNPSINTKILDSIKPDEGSLEDHQIAVKFGFERKEWDVAFVYFYGWSSNPVFFRKDVIMPSKPTDPATLVLEPRYERVHRFGLTLDKSFSFLGHDWVGRIESLYKKNDYISTNNEPLNEDGQVKRDKLLTSFALETDFFIDWNFLLTIIPEYTFGSVDGLRYLPARIPLHRWENNYSLTITKNFYYNRATFSLTISQGDYGDGRLRPRIFYKLSDFITLSMGAHFFWGGDDTLIGQFSRNDELEFGIKYEF